MLPEIGATELMVIAAVALIVVGPKDLPMLLRKLGGLVARLRGMASEFRTSFDDMARQSELDDLRKEVAAMRSTAATETSNLNSAIGDMNQTLHDDITLAELRETPAVDPDAFDPNYQLYGEEAQPLSPADVAPKPAKAPRAPRAKTTISKVPVAEIAEAAPVAVKPKAAKPRAPRKAAT